MSRFSQASGTGGLPQGWGVVEGPPPAGPPREHCHQVMGLDLGQLHDPSAAVVLEKRHADAGFAGPVSPKVVCRSMRRWPTGTEYRTVVNDALDYGADVIVVDYGGVGVAVVEDLRRVAARKRYRGKVRPVCLVASNGTARMLAEQGGVRWNVPKVDVVSSLAVMQQRQVLSFQGGLLGKDDWEQFARELGQFQLKYSKRTVQFGNEPVAGGHDDLILALCLACWWALKYGVRQLAVDC